MAILEHLYTRETIIDRLNEIYQLLLQEDVKIGDLSQEQQSQVGAVVGKAIDLLKVGRQ